MKNKISLFLALLASILMVGCNASKEITVTSLSSMQEYIENANTQMQNDGYYLTNIKKEGSGDSKKDTYSFSDTNDNTIEFTISFNQKRYKELYYIDNVNVSGCNVSKKEEYDKYCGLHAPIRLVEQLPEDTTAREFSQGKLIFNSVGIPSIILGGLSLGSIILYQWIKSQYYMRR